MPTLSKRFTLDVTPEQFLSNSSPEELYEALLLLHSPRYQDKLATVIFQNDEVIIPSHSQE